MPKNFLHIWPRGDFMMIALPNDVRCRAVCELEIITAGRVVYGDAVHAVGEVRGD